MAIKNNHYCVKRLQVDNKATYNGLNELREMKCTNDSFLNFVGFVGSIEGLRETYEVEDYTGGQMCLVQGN